MFFDQFDKIILASDNGNGFRGYNLLYFYSTWASTYGKVCEVELLCPKHAWSLCDAHGGNVGDLLYQHMVQGSVKGANAVADVILDSSIRDTIVYAHTSADFKFPSTFPGKGGVSLQVTIHT